MQLNEIFHGESLKAEELKGKDVTLTIAGWSLKEFEEKGKIDRKVELRFAETDRTFILNKTNGYQIAEYLGTENLDDWPGSKVTLYPTKTDFGGKRVDCIRVKAAQRPQGVSVPQVDETDHNEVPF